MGEERERRMLSVVERRQFDITVVMENVHDIHNIAAVMRTCDAVGIQEIYILNNRIPAHDRPHRKKTSSSASKWLDIIQFIDAEECFSVVRSKYKNIYATFVDNSARDMYDVDYTKPCALIFGNEHSGVSPDILRYADASIVIPQVGMIPSLNISVACAVMLYEAFRQKRTAGHYDRSDYFPSEKKALKQKWQLNI